MDLPTFLLSFISPFLPSPVVYFLHTHLEALLAQLEACVSPFIPAPLLQLIQRNLPYILSALAVYFGALQVLRTARGALRTLTTLLKYALLALTLSTAYTLWQGDIDALRSQAAAVPGIVGQAWGYAGGLTTLVGWWLGATGENGENLKRAGEWARGYFSGGDGDDGASGGKKTKKRRSGGSSSSYGKRDAAPPSSRTRSKAKVKDPKDLFADTFGSGAGAAGAARGEEGEGLADVVQEFVDKVVGATGGGEVLKEMMRKFVGGQGGQPREEEEREEGKGGGWWGTGKTRRR